MKTYCGKTQEQMNDILDSMCNIEDRIKLTSEEQKAFDVGIQCITTIINCMSDINHIKDMIVDE